MGGRGAGSGISGRGYHEFGDKALGTHAFVGDGASTIGWFDVNSNYNELINDMDDGDKRAFYAYSRGALMFGDIYNGWDTLDISEKEIVQRMDDILDRSVLDEGITVKRLADSQLILGKGRREASLEELQAMKGEVISTKGHLSCAAASEGLSIGRSVGTPGGRGMKNVEYSIHINGGSDSEGAGTWIGDKRINGWGAQQREFVANRDTSWRVGDTRYNASRDIYETDLFYDGRFAHDYGTSGRIKY